MGVYSGAGKSVVHFLSTISQVTAGLTTNVILKPRATDATLLDVTCCVCLHTLLHVVECCWESLRKVRNWPTMLGVVASVYPWSKRHHDRLLSYMEKEIETCLLNYYI